MNCDAASQNHAEGSNTEMHVNHENVKVVNVLTIFILNKYIKNYLKFIIPEFLGCWLRVIIKICILNVKFQKL